MPACAMCRLALHRHSTLINRKHGALSFTWQKTMNERKELQGQGSERSTKGRAVSHGKNMEAADSFSAIAITAWNIAFARSCWPEMPYP